MARRRTTPAPEEGLPTQGEPEATTPAPEDGLESTAPETEPEPEPEVSAPAPEEGLVAVSLGGEVLHVHPTCLKAHLDLGWKPVE